MLVLTRKLGQAIHIGEHVRIRLRDKTRFHAVVAVLAPLELPVEWDDRPVRPAWLPQGGGMSLIPLLSGERFRVGDALVRVWFDTGPGARRYRERAVRFGVGAPLDVAVHREEVLARIRASQPVESVPQDGAETECADVDRLAWESAA